MNLVRATIATAWLLLVCATPAAAGYADARTPALGGSWRLGHGAPAAIGDAYDHAGRSAFSFTGWLQASSGPARTSAALISKVSARGGYSMALGPASRRGRHRWRLAFERRSRGGADVVATSLRLVAGRSHHVAATYDGRTLKLFVDGRRARSVRSVRSLPDTSAALRLGLVAAGPGVRGWLEDVAVHRRALAAASVRRLHAARGGPAAGAPRSRRTDGPLPTATPAPTTPPTPAAANPAMTPSPAPSGRAVTRAPNSPVLSDADAAARVRRSPWEPRPLNATPNRRLPTPEELAAFRAASNEQTPYARLVSGGFAGTTDELIQWTAHKWGFDEDILRAQAAWESSWSQSAAGDGGISFGLMQIKSTIWRGTAPLSRVSTPFNVDMHGAILRQCYDGRATWLGDGYRGGDLWGCLGYYFSGAWNDAGGTAYAGSVPRHLAERSWERPEF